jgi:hypothetical protein
VSVFSTNTLPVLEQAQLTVKGLVNYLYGGDDGDGDGDDVHCPGLY